EQADGAERLVRQAVRRADEREVVEARALELVADAREGAPHGERLREHVEQCRPLLERVHQAAVGADLLGAEVVEQARGTTDVQLAVVLDLVERAADPCQERLLPWRQARLLERAREQS